MKTTNTYDTGDTPVKASLYQVVDQLLKNSLPAATRNRNSIINNVPSKLSVNADEEIVTSVIRGMLHAEVINAADSVIYISAKELYGNMIEVNVKDDNCYNTYAVALSLQDVVPLAEKVGGNLNITNQKQKITTISFRYPVAKDESN